MPGAPPDWFASGESTVSVDDPTVADDDASATGEFDFGRIDTAPVPVPTAGTTIDRYLLETLIGEGAMGQVWRARDPQLDRAVAIKVVHPAIAAAPDGGPRLLREARAMAKLSHPNVVTVHDAGDDAGRLFVAMDLVEGVTLGEWLRGRADPHDWRATLARFRDAGRGLAAAHAGGILHRDFKPDNVLIDRAGRVCVADFGLAAFGRRLEPTRRTSRAHDQVVSDLTAAGTVLGTPAFMSPEQLRGEVIDARADQFSFCASLYEALYGEHPFLGREAMTIAALVDAIDRGAVRPAPADDRVPRWLRAAVVRGLAAAPAARWPDLPALLAALVPPRRVPPLAIVAVAVAVTAAVVATIVVVRARATVHARPPATVTAVRRFDVSLASRIALAPDGRRVAIATTDRIDVRAIDGAPVWSHLDPTDPIERVAFADRDHVLIAYTRPLRLEQVTLPAGGVTEVARWPGWDRWLGRVDGHEVVARIDGAGWQLGLGAGAAVTPLVQIDHPAQVVAGSPDGRRLALLLERRYDGQIVVLDARGVVARSAWLPGATAVAWADDDTLLYAIGTVDRPTLWRADLVGAALAPARLVYRIERGWFGQIVVGGDRVMFIDSGATFRSRVLDRAGASTVARDLDPATVGAALAWMDDGTFLVWNRASGGIERHGPTGAVATTPARLDGEIISATRAGDVVIAALRRDAGREVVAVSIADGRERWRVPPGVLRTVRCTDDRAPPCLLVRDGDDATARRLAWVEPGDGAVGATVGPAGRIDDVALTAGGARLLLADGTRDVVELDLTAGAEVRVETDLSPRALAFDPRGGLLLTGSTNTTRYSLVALGPAGATEVYQSRDEILFQPRPSPDGRAVIVMGRLFLPVLYELPRAAVR
ncbi:MAG: serine/threonine protein kinase [Myxococcales bacterium]|nr:serine/threonine protein kinase [Myxococcales bacterium]